LRAQEALQPQQAVQSAASLLGGGSTPCHRYRARPHGHRGANKGSPTLQTVLPELLERRRSSAESPGIDLSWTPIMMALPVSRGGGARTGMTNDHRSAPSATPKALQTPPPTSLYAPSSLPVLRLRSQDCISYSLWARPFPNQPSP
jgi:hypothetical protein